MKENFKNYEADYAQLVELHLPANEEPFILNITKDNVLFEFLIRLKANSDKVIVLGSGAYNAKSELKPPIFQRHKWMGDFEENLIYYNDPTLYLGEINMGWGFGLENRHYLKEIGEILAVLLEKMQIDREKTLFYGSSAGGFMSLMLAGFLRGTQALVNNPQTIVWNYYPGHVRNMFTAAIPRLSKEEVIESYPERLNISEFYKQIGYVPVVTYLQNTASERDLTHHMNPFVLGLSEIDDSCFAGEVTFKMHANKEIGHSPLPQKESLQQIRKAVAKL